MAAPALDSTSASEEGVWPRTPSPQPGANLRITPTNREPPTPPFQTPQNIPIPTKQMTMPDWQTSETRKASVTLVFFKIRKKGKVHFYPLAFTSTMLFKSKVRQTTLVETTLRVPIASHDSPRSRKEKPSVPQPGRTDLAVEALPGIQQNLAYGKKTVKVMTTSLESIMFALS